MQSDDFGIHLVWQSCVLPVSLAGSFRSDFIEFMYEEKEIWVGLILKK